MPRFFVPSTNIDGVAVRITGEDAWHIARSLRMAVGECVTVCDMHGGEHTCILEKITDEAVDARITESLHSSNESPVRITLYQALPKGDKMDLIVQKAVESGVYSILPFLSERCISRPDEKSLAKKTARWQRIALEAAKQCGRGIIPTVGKTLSYHEMLAAAGGADLCCFCYEGDGTQSLRTVLSGEAAKRAETVALVIGSEGGFSAAEAERAKESGACLCGLGKRILRCESASGFALACMAYEYEL